MVKFCNNKDKNNVQKQTKLITKDKLSDSPPLRKKRCLLCRIPIGLCRLFLMIFCCGCRKKTQTTKQQEPIELTLEQKIPDQIIVEPIIDQPPEEIRSDQTSEDNGLNQVPKTNEPDRQDNLEEQGNLDNIQPTITETDPKKEEPYVLANMEVILPKDTTIKLTQNTPDSPIYLQIVSRTKIFCGGQVSQKSVVRNGMQVQVRCNPFLVLYKAIIPKESMTEDQIVIRCEDTEGEHLSDLLQQKIFSIEIKDYNRKKYIFIRPSQDYTHLDEKYDSFWQTIMEPALFALSKRLIGQIECCPVL